MILILIPPKDCYRHVYNYGITWVMVSNVFLFSSPFEVSWSNLTHIFQLGWFNHQLDGFFLSTSRIGKGDAPFSQWPVGTYLGSNFQEIFHFLGSMFNFRGVYTNQHLPRLSIHSFFSLVVLGPTYRWKLRLKRWHRDSPEHWNAWGPRNLPESGTLGLSPRWFTVVLKRGETREPVKNQGGPFFWRSVFLCFVFFGVKTFAWVHCCWWFFCLLRLVCGPWWFLVRFSFSNNVNGIQPSSCLPGEETPLRSGTCTQLQGCVMDQIYKWLKYVESCNAYPATNLPYNFGTTRKRSSPTICPLSVYYLV